MTRLTLLLFGFMVLCITCAAGDIELAYLNCRPAKVKGGTLYGMIVNGSDSAVTVEQVRVDGIVLPVMNTSKPKPGEPEGKELSLLERERMKFGHHLLLWGKVGDNKIKAQSATGLWLYLSQKLTRPSNLEIELSNGTTLKRTFGKQPAALETVSVTFSSDHRTLHAFIRNATREYLHVKRILLAAEDLTSASQVPVKRIRPTDVAPIIVSLPKSVKRGDMVHLRIQCEDGIETAASVRVFGDFPLTSEHGNPAGFNLDPEPYSKRAKTGKAPDSATSYHIFDCPMHANKNNHAYNAKEITSRQDALWSQNHAASCSVHVCRVRPREGCHIFGATTDIVRINPFIYDKIDMRHAELVRDTVAINAPRPVHSLIATDNRKGQCSSEDLRRNVFMILGQAPKGFLYRHSGWNNSPLNPHIRQVNREIQVLKPLIHSAAQLPWGQTDIEGVHAFPIISPDGKVTLCIVSFADTSKKNVAIKLLLPEWCKLSKARPVSPEGLGDPIAIDPKSLTLPLPKDGAAFVLE